mmetsp:Transcript_42/g.82  ORF Transcript_42/g.82 Transcript_42/m.82 type:complete len:607 (-) Transcript_42:322-2142(-)
MVKGSKSSSSSALRYFVREAQKAGTVISNAILGKPTKRKSAVSKTRYVKGIKNGKYFRYKIKEPKSTTIATVPKLPPLGPQTVPKPLTNPSPPPPLPSSSSSASASAAGTTPVGVGAVGVGGVATTTAAAATMAQQAGGPASAAAAAAASKELGRSALAGSSGGSSRTFRAYEWLKQNMAVLVLNTGSICTLIGFTRSDVLELRSFSMSGSIASVIYFAMCSPIRWAPIAWSGLFASVNGYKIGKIYVERKGKVVLTEKEQDVFVEHFMPHGTTPKQFEKIIKQKATKLTYKKGDCIVRQGEPSKHVYLIVHGKTQASVLGRRLTAISSAPGARDERMGGDSGAWLGEMAFLEAFAEREMLKGKSDSTNASSTTPTAAGSSSTTAVTTIAKKLSDKMKGLKTTNTASSEASSSSDSSDSGSSKLSTFLFKEEKEGSSSSSGEEEETNTDETSSLSLPGKIISGRAMAGSLSTVIAEEDNVEVLRWSHEDIEELMHTSTDMRAALTRAMTAPIVGKVINFTVSARTNNRPTWSTWLDDWKQSGAIVNITRKNRQQENRSTATTNEDEKKKYEKEDNASTSSTAGEDENDSAPIVLATALKKALQGQP